MQKVYHLPSRDTSTRGVITFKGDTLSKRDLIPVSFMNLILETAYLHKPKDKEYRPSSLCLIGQSGIGKTRLIETLRPLKFVYYCEDITPKHLRDVLETAKKHEKRFIVIPDFNSIVGSHGRKTYHTTISMLREIMSEGITNLSAYGMEFQSDYPIKLGLITAITVENWNDFKWAWKKTGFLNRFIPYSFKHSTQTETEILNSIFSKARKRFLPDNLYTIIKRPPKNIEMNPELLTMLSSTARTLGIETAATPYRDAIRLRDLLEAYLIINKEPKLTPTHINQFTELIRYVNYNFNEV
jgi:hypothetical protein